MKDKTLNKILENGKRYWKSQGILSVQKIGNHVLVMYCFCWLVELLFRLILTPCTVHCRCTGWSLYPVLLLAGVQAPCTAPCRSTGWFLHPVLLLAGLQADPYTLYCYLQVYRLILMPSIVPCRLILTPCTVTCRSTGWSLHPVLLLAGLQADPYAQYCSLQADPYTLYCYLQVYRLILTPCTVTCRSTGWFLHPVLLLAGLQADPYTLYCSL